MKSHGLNVAVFEAEGRAGGKLRSVSHDGLIWDEGANTMVKFFLFADWDDNEFLLETNSNGGFVAVQTESEPEVRSLLDDLGLREKQQFVRVFFVVSNI